MSASQTSTTEKIRADCKIDHLDYDSSTAIRWIIIVLNNFTTTCVATDLGYSHVMVHSVIFSSVKLDIVYLKLQEMKNLQNLEKETALVVVLFIQ